MTLAAMRIRLPSLQRPAAIGHRRRSLTSTRTNSASRRKRNVDQSSHSRDAICGSLIGPLLLQQPELCQRMRAWARHRNMWVRRASIVGLIARARRGESLDLVYEIARRLHGDREDLIQKAVGWALREAGKADMARLERYLRAAGPAIPRTTLRYAIERFPEPKRRALLAATR